MAATIKHFGAYGAVQAGREYAATDMSEQQLLNIYLPPYKAAVGAGAATVMSAFPSLDGVPASANPYLLTTILCKEWQFGGTAISDYQAIQELEEFGYATSGEQAAQLALTAGVDIEMGVQVPSQYSTYTLYGADLVKTGKVSMATINNDVRHVLTLKFLAGLFDHPLTDPNRVKTAELTPANLAAARAMADESMVLLNNQNHALPLSTSVPSIAVVGPLADDPSDQLGPDVPIGYSSSDLNSVVPVPDGIKAAAPHATVTYAQGCDAYCTSTAGFGAAVSAASSCTTLCGACRHPALPTTPATTPDTAWRAWLSPTTGPAPMPATRTKGCHSATAARLRTSSRRTRRSSRWTSPHSRPTPTSSSFASYTPACTALTASSTP
jgi:beta-glucosidase